MQPDERTENSLPESEETKKSVETGEKVIDFNKKMAAQDGKDPEKEEKKDEEKWRREQ
jgi:hypothetical protein